MIDKTEIHAEIAELAATIKAVRAALTRNEIMEMKGIPERVRGVADAITDLEPDDAAALRPSLTELLADFEAFATELKSKIEEIQSTAGAPIRSAASS